MLKINNLPVGIPTGSFPVNMQPGQIFLDEDTKNNGTYVLRIKKMISYKETDAQRASVSLKGYNFSIVRHANSVLSVSSEAPNCRQVVFSSVQRKPLISHC